MNSDPRFVSDYYMNDPLKALSQHATQREMITLLKSGKLTYRWVVERDDKL